MHLTQFVILEISEKCNRGKEHWQCPNLKPERWEHSAGRRPMSIGQMVDIAVHSHAGGFRGCYAYHHYGEPLAEWVRLRDTVAAINAAVPQARHLMWTNGDYFASIPREEIDGVFEKMMVTDYAKRGLDYPRSICKEVHEIPVGLDWRLNPPRSPVCREPNCIRPYLEIIFDYYGNVRTCCMDWKNETGIGNIHDTPFEELWQRWIAQRDRLASMPMSENAPHRCLTCGTRYTQLASYVPEITARTLAHLDGK